MKMFDVRITCSLTSQGDSSVFKWGIRTRGSPYVICSRWHFKNWAIVEKGKNIHNGSTEATRCMSTIGRFLTHQYVVGYTKTWQRKTVQEHLQAYKHLQASTLCTQTHWWATLCRWAKATYEYIDSLYKIIWSWKPKYFCPIHAWGQLTFTLVQKIKRNGNGSEYLRTSLIMDAALVGALEPHCYHR